MVGIMRTGGASGRAFLTGDSSSEWVPLVAGEGFGAGSTACRFVWTGPGSWMGFLLASDVEACRDNRPCTVGELEDAFLEQFSLESVKCKPAMVEVGVLFAVATGLMSGGEYWVEASTILTLG